MKVLYYLTVLFLNLPNLHEIIIGGFNGLIDDLVIENYPNLERIVVKKGSLRNLNSLKICNNEKLKIIEIDDGDYDDEDCTWYCSLHHVLNFAIESI